MYFIIIPMLSYDVLKSVTIFFKSFKTVLEDKNSVYLRVGTMSGDSTIELFGSKALK